MMVLIIKCQLYGIIDTEPCIIYYYRACITKYILLLPSFYHSLGRFLTTLNLRAQVGDLRYRCTRYFPRLFWDRHPFQFIGIFVICFCYLIYLCFHICYDPWPLLQVFLYLFMLDLLCILYIIPVWGLAYIRDSISALHIYVTVASPYPWDRGVTIP